MLEANVNAAMPSDLGRLREDHPGFVEAASEPVAFAVVSAVVATVGAGAFVTGLGTLAAAAVVNAVG
ncbi:MULTISPECIES: hypothetical protein [unclassified Streptomyces]|uniref:hypothetical protein n=1 Tax=unclassified Streptomyces TaxID=2593676 RepID=UPI0019068F11|nr:hypothetical protein [Streptomyces sp. HSG2]